MGERIIYYSIDAAVPSGGVRTIYHHVAHLNNAGLPAFVMQQTPGFKPSWFPDPVPTLHLDTFTGFKNDDVLIVPESLTKALLALPKLASRRKVVFCQNHFYAIPGLANAPSWRDLSVTDVLASSEPIADFVAAHMGFPRPTVAHCAIDLELFQPRPKNLQIAFMPRKRPIEAAFISGLCARNPLLRDVPWLRIDGMNEASVAAALGESAIFLSLGSTEGFGLPPIEAMACGCLVIGYHAFGGLEYATDQNGIWLDDKDPIAIVNAIADAVAQLRISDPQTTKMIEAGRQTAMQYSLARQASEVVAFGRSVLGT